MRAHTITTKASTIVSGGILALGLAVVLLAATASTASADTDLDLWCAPLPTTSTTLEQIDGGCFEPAGRREVFDFGDRQVGTTSPAQGFALGIKPSTTPSTPRSASPATTPRPITAHRRCRPDAMQLPHHRHLHPHGHRAQARHPAHRTRGPDGGADRQRGHHPDPAGPAPDARRVRAGPPAAGEEGRGQHHSAWMEIGHCHVLGCPDYDAKLVLGGDVIKTTKHFRPNDASRHPDRGQGQAPEAAQEGADEPQDQIKFTATDEFGQRVTEERKVELCSRLIHVDRENMICRWHPSQK